MVLIFALLPCWLFDFVPSDSRCHPLFQRFIFFRWMFIIKVETPRLPAFDTCHFLESYRSNEFGSWTDLDSIKYSRRVMIFSSGTWFYQQFSIFLYFIHLFNLLYYYSLFAVWKWRIKRENQPLQSNPSQKKSKRSKRRRSVHCCWCYSRSVFFVSWGYVVIT